MAEVKWIKLITAFFDDEKIRLIEDMPEADTILIIWIKLLTLAGKKNQAGYIYLTEKLPYTDEMLATIFKRPLNTIRLALSTFKKLEMIDVNKAGIIKMVNWEKHQNIEALEKIRELGRKRIQKFRAKNKELSEPKKKSNVTETLGNGIDKIREDEISIIGSLDPTLKKKETGVKDPLEFDFKEKRWINLFDWRIIMYQGKFPRLTVNYLFNDRWKTKFIADPAKYQKMIKEKYNGKIEKLVWAWLVEEEKDLGKS